MARPGHLLYASKEQDYTTLRQPWLNIARVLWIVVSAAALIALIVGAVLAWGAPLPACTAPGAACGPWSVSRESSRARLLGFSFADITVALKLDQVIDTSSSSRLACGSCRVACYTPPRKS